MTLDKKKLVPIVLAAVVAVGAFITDGDIGAALKIAFDKDAAITECTALLKDADAAAVASAPAVTP